MQCFTLNWPSFVKAIFIRPYNNQKLYIYNTYGYVKSKTGTIINSYSFIFLCWVLYDERLLYFITHVCISLFSLCSSRERGLYDFILRGTLSTCLLYGLFVMQPCPSSPGQNVNPETAFKCSDLQTLSSAVSLQQARSKLIFLISF